MAIFKTIAGHLLDWAGVANVPAALKALAGLKGEAGQIIEIGGVDAQGGVTELVAVDKPGGGADSGQNLNLTVEIITVGEDSGGPVAVTGVALDLTSYSAKVGGGFYINPVVLPTNATNRSVGWQSSKPAVAAVNDMGYVECIAEGDAVITCTTEDGGFTATCAVSVAAESGGDSGDDSGGTAGQKIQFSTLEMTAGFMKADGTVATLSKTYHVALPYTEGMQISTGTNASWNISDYPPIVVLNGGSYSVPDGILGDTTVTGSNSAVVTPYTATLTGYSADAVVYVSLYNGSESNSVAALERMDSNDIYWYIPGGES